ncbi:MAG TPA: hypothetical protein VKU41_24310 [Polyangiaceae bacterium]|nr:hypothetical protein [Polyangiaceae bacterium]
MQLHVVPPLGRLPTVHVPELPELDPELEPLADPEVEPDEPELEPLPEPELEPDAPELEPLLEPELEPEEPELAPPLEAEPEPDAPELEPLPAPEPEEPELKPLPDVDPELDCLPELEPLDPPELVAPASFPSDPPVLSDDEQEASAATSAGRARRTGVLMATFMGGGCGSAVRRRSADVLRTSNGSCVGKPFTGDRTVVRVFEESVVGSGGMHRSAPTRLVQWRPKNALDEAQRHGTAQLFVVLRGAPNYSDVAIEEALMTWQSRAAGLGSLAIWLAACGLVVTAHCGNTSGSGAPPAPGCNGASCTSDTTSSGSAGPTGDDGSIGLASPGDSDAGGGQGAGGGDAGGGGGGPKDAAASPRDGGGVSTGADATAAGCGATTWPMSGDFNMNVGGTMRQYIVTLPSSYKSSTPYKLILAWHGLGGSAAQVAGQGLGAFGSNYAYYGLQALANDTVIFVAGQGLDPHDSGAGWPNTNDQDIAFTQALVQWLESNYCVDEKHIFSVGMSYGGIMSDTVGCEMGNVVRAIAPMSGSGPYSYFGAKPCVGEVAVWSSHGTQDTTVPFEAGVASRNHWIAANHCSNQITAVGPGTCVEYQGCDPGYPVDWCEFDGGHTIPSFAAQGIWSFLSRF